MTSTTTILEIATRAQKAHSATEKAEILASLRELGAGETQEALIWNLLNAVLQIEQEKAQFREVLNRWLDIAEFINTDKLASFMVGAKPGGFVSDIVLNFLKRCRKDWEDDLQSGYDEDMKTLMAKWKPKK